MNSKVRSLIFWFVICSLVVLLWQAVQGPESQLSPLSFTDFLAAVEEGRVERVTLRGHEIRGTLDDGTDFKTFAPEYPGLVDKLKEADVVIQAQPPRGNPLLALFLTWGPVLLIVGLWIFFMRRFISGKRNASSSIWEEGRRNGQVSLLKRQLEQRFGGVPNWATSRLEEAGSEQLERWGERILDARRLEDVFEER